MSQRLKDKVAVITGAGSGIGKAFAFRFSEEGAKVVIPDINFENASKVADEISSKGREAIAVKTDVSSESDVTTMAETALKKYGTIDILINNAAMFGELRPKPWDSLTLEEWNKLLSINVIGVWLCCKAVTPVMLKKGKGKIINIGSNVIHCPPFVADHNLHYAASKAAVYTMTQALARALSPSGINVNVIGPGITGSEGAMQAVGGDKETWKIKAWDMIKDAQCIKRVQLPEDLAGTAVFLASDDSDFITGQFLAVDGGTWLK
jgi:3-oxoacyl-[acyl-carrier protein] reductase